ncbi:hypothetical protein Gotri_002174 [Gossypium trilobum]|uniref:Uncharacterized protein n=1 Tax=Gossypium trilobum TaxID=34281 RepID=A0A7J9F7F3_9ROSI|nr:hypothetical protein [Gossypium trilobum]
MWCLNGFQKQSQDRESYTIFLLKLREDHIYHLRKQNI